MDINVDFFDRVMEASVMKINNLKLHPHIASFIAGALAEQAADVKDTIGSMVGNGKIKAMQWYWIKPMRINSGILKILTG